MRRSVIVIGCIALVGVVCLGLFVHQVWLKPKPNDQVSSTNLENSTARSSSNTQPETANLPKEQNDSTDEEDVPPLPQTPELEGKAFIVMDVEEMRAYRDARRELLDEALTQSPQLYLYPHHRTLVANAIAKAYVGIPVSSYTESTQTKINRVVSADGTDTRWEVSDSTDTFHVSVDGHLQQESLEQTSNLGSSMTFLHLHPVPFDAKTARLLKESETTATFEFAFDFSQEYEDEDDVNSDYAEPPNWVLELTVNKADQAPELISVKLISTRYRVLGSRTHAQFDFEYAFIESCECFAVNKTRYRVWGSTHDFGRLVRDIETTSTEISCEQPMKFLLPNVQESGTFLFTPKSTE